MLEFRVDLMLNIAGTPTERVLFGPRRTAQALWRVSTDHKKYGRTPRDTSVGKLFDAVENRWSKLLPRQLVSTLRPFLKFGTNDDNLEQAAKLFDVMRSRLDKTPHPELDVAEGIFLELCQEARVFRKAVHAQDRDALLGLCERSLFADAPGVTFVAEQLASRGRYIPIPALVDVLVLTVLVHQAALLDDLCRGARASRGDFRDVDFLDAVPNEEEWDGFEPMARLLLVAREQANFKTRAATAEAFMSGAGLYRGENSEPEKAGRRLYGGTLPPLTAVDFATLPDFHCLRLLFIAHFVRGIRRESELVERRLRRVSNHYPIDLPFQGIERTRARFKEEWDRWAVQKAVPPVHADHD